MKLNPEEIVYIRSMGKILRVTAIFNNDIDANKYMEKHGDQGVIACFDNRVYIAYLYDKGIEVTK